MSEDCVFCRIARGESAAEVVYADDAVMAFKDLYPKAAIHLLIIPRRHVDSLAHLQPGDTELMGRCVLLARVLGEQTGYADRGYRLTCHCGAEGGQVVNHLHFHFMAGRRG